MASIFSCFFFLQSNSLDEWTNFLGHFHPAIVHLPIGILVIGILLEYLNFRRSIQGLHSAINIIFFWGAITAIFSCIAGYFLMQTGGYEEDTLKWHQYLGISVAIISTVIYLFKKLNDLSWLSFLNKLNKPLLIILTILLLVTGHLGGNMTHGSDYLMAGLPQPFKGWLGIETKSDKAAEHIISDPAKAIAYIDVIQPILENKCYKCHSAEKQKGKLRMDTQSFFSKGGEDGPIFLAGNASGSEMIKRALLPENDDDHMPPKGKTQLTENEIALIHWWIQSGASFDKKVNDLPQDEKVKPVLATLMAGASLAGLELKRAPESPIYTLKVEAASEDDINKLRKKNVLVLPLAKDLNLLEVSCINDKDFNDEDTKLLTELSEQLVWLKLSNTKITDVGIPNIGKLKILVKLFLNHSKITDKGLDNLLILNNLEYLNLVDTQITDEGLAKLSGLKSLKKLYLWQTKVTKQAVESFRKANPKIIVDMGWEGKVINSDSILVEKNKSK